MACCRSCEKGAVDGLIDDFKALPEKGRGKVRQFIAMASDAAAKWDRARVRLTTLATGMTAASPARAFTLAKAAYVDQRRRDALYVREWLYDALDLLGDKTGAADASGARSRAEHRARGAVGAFPAAIPLGKVVVGGVAIASVSALVTWLTTQSSEAELFEAHTARMKLASDCLARETGPAKDVCAQALLNLSKQEIKVPSKPLDGLGTGLTAVAVVVALIVSAKLANVF